MNFAQFASLGTLTNLPAVQSAVTLINEPDLVTVVDVLESKSLLKRTATGGLLSNVISFVSTIETLLPLVTDIKSVVAYLILEQLGLTDLQDIVNGSVPSSLPGGSRSFASLIVVGRER